MKPKQDEPYSKLSVAEITEKLAEFADVSLIALKLKDFDRFADYSECIMQLNLQLLPLLSEAPPLNKAEIVECFRIIIRNALLSGNITEIPKLFAMIHITEKKEIAKYMLLNFF